MSRIPDVGKKLENLVSVLAEYDEPLKDTADLINLKGKQVAAANTENPSWQLFYDQKRIELNSLVRLLEREVQRVRSTLYRSYKESHSRELSEREINKYIDSEQAYLDMFEILLEVKELSEKYQAVVDAFTTRGYALNNLTKLYVGGLEHVES